jgi:hypothetical protein
MKINLILIAMVLFASQAIGQKKGKVDPKDVTIDSLKMANTNLSADLDSVKMISDTCAAVYQRVYTAIKDKVLKHDFDPAMLPHIIDSLKTSRESAFAGMEASSTTLKDSITTLNAEVVTLNATIAKMEAATADKEKLVAEMKQLKELLDTGVITQAEFDAKKAKLMEKWQ